MKDIVEIPVTEYEAMKETIALLKDAELLKKVNRLVDLLYEEKYGLYLGDTTLDLTHAVVQNNWQQPNSPWDHV